MIELIAQNPYRTLGVYVNSTLKERLANVNRFKAFDKVGKSVETDVDFNVVLENYPNRSIANIDCALHALTLPIDQLKQAVFWLASSIPADEIAIKNLSAGRLEKARSIERKFAVWSSFLNYHTLSLLAGDLKGAVTAFIELASNYKQQFLNGLGLDTLVISEEEFVELYYNQLSKEYTTKEIYSVFELTSFEGNKILDIIAKRISRECIEKLNYLVSVAKETSNNDSNANLNAGIALKTSSFPILVELKEIAASNSNYNIIADKVALQVLQNGINYYNASNEEDAARHAMPLIEFAKDTAVGKVAQERCNDNYKVLRKAYDRLPPKTVLYYHRLLTKIINEYNSKASTIDSASKFIDKCFPYLMSIRSSLGPSNTYYRMKCTQIAAYALEGIISDYNKKNESFHKLLEKVSGSFQNRIISQIQEMMKSAVITMYHIKHLELEHDFRKERFNKNYEIIVNQARNARALGVTSISAILGGEVTEADFNNDLKNYEPDLRDETGYYSSIRNLQDCYEYSRIFPGGKFTTQVNAKVEEYEYQECSSLEDLQKFSIRYPSTKFDISSKREEIVFKSCKTIDDYKSYIAKYSTYRKEAEKRIDDLIFAMCHDKGSYVHYLTSYPLGAHRLEAQQKIEDIDYRACKSAEDFEKYLRTYQTGRNVTNAKKRLEEERLWALCNQKDSWKLYKEYVDKYPHGKYYKQAKEQSISPGERFKKFISNNGCMTTIVILLLIAIIIGACTNGIEGVGAVFAGFAFLCACLAVGKGDVGGETRLIALVLAIISGLIAYAILS